MSDIFNMADTWNAVGTVWTAIKMNVTDSGSAAGSLLMDLQVGGVTKFAIEHKAYANSGSLRLSAAGGHPQLLLSPAVSGFLAARQDSIASYLDFNARAFIVPSTGSIQFWNGTAFNSGAADVILQRDAANTLALRNGTAPQQFSVYDSYTDVSNYRRVAILGGVSAGIIALEGAGTGANGSLYIRASAGAAGSIELGVAGTDRWRITATGHFLAIADNTYDIGASGATRPRNIYIGGAMIAGLYASLRGNVRIDATAGDGIIIISNAAVTDLNRVQLGGVTSSFPAIARDGLGIAIKLADNTDGGHIKPGKYPTASLPAAATAGAGALVYDTTTNKMKFSTGSAWETVTSA